MVYEVNRSERMCMYMYLSVYQHVYTYIYKYVCASIWKEHNEEDSKWKLLNCKVPKRGTHF